MPTAEVRGQTIHYTDTGGDGPVVVFSHGFLMDDEMFAPQVSELARDHRVITWDWRGFGRTQTDGRPFTVWDQAEDLLGLLDHLGCETAVLGGMSHGGYISMRVPLLAPHRVRALILMDTNASGLSDEEKAGYQHLFARWHDEGPTDELTGLFASLIIGHPDHDAIWTAKWKARPRELMAAPARATVEAENILPRLREVSCPALVLHGAEDAAFPRSHGEDIASALPQAKPLVVVPGGHAANLTHPEAVNAEIRTFLDSLWGLPREPGRE